MEFIQGSFSLCSCLYLFLSHIHYFADGELSVFLMIFINFINEVMTAAFINLIDNPERENWFHFYEFSLISDLGSYVTFRRKSNSSSYCTGF